jgi:hypothetical protein
VSGVTRLLALGIHMLPEQWLCHADARQVYDFVNGLGDSLRLREQWLCHADARQVYDLPLPNQANPLPQARGNRIIADRWKMTS